MERLFYGKIPEAVQKALALEKKESETAQKGQICGQKKCRTLTLIEKQSEYCELDEINTRK